MFRCYNLRQKEVVNIKTAEKLGFVRDVEISETTGNIEALIVPRGSLLRRLFGGGELIIPWNAVEVVGKEIILVRIFDNGIEKIT